MDTFNIILALMGLLVTMWGIIAGKEGIEARRFLAWCVLVLVTLIAPSIFITWAALQISARILAPTTDDVASFVSQIAWAIGLSSYVYPLIWGIRLYPKLNTQIEQLVPSTDSKPEIKKE